MALKLVGSLPDNLLKRPIHIFDFQVRIKDSHRIGNTPENAVGVFLEIKNLLGFFEHLVFQP